MVKKKIFRSLSIFLAAAMLLGSTVPAGAAPEQDTAAEAEKENETAVSFLPKTDMQAEASSSGGEAYTPDKAIDGDTGTLWHGRWEGEDIPPHWISLKLDKEDGSVKQVRSVTLTSRNDVNPAHESINNVSCTIWVSQDGQNYEEAATDVKLNDGGGSATVITVNREASYLKITGSGNFMAVAEIDVSVYRDDIDMGTRIELQQKIEEARALLAEAVIGTDFGQYPREAADALEHVILQAEAALEEDNSQAEQALGNIDVAIETFKNSMRTFQKSDLEALLQEARTLNEQVQIGSEAGNCSEEAKKSFEAAIRKAEESLTEADAEKLYQEFTDLKKAVAVFTAGIIILDEKDSLDISGTWNFEMAAKENAKSLAETVVLPGSMDENHKGIDNSENITDDNLNRDYVYVGAATYQRQIEIPEEWEGKHIELFLERTRKTRVWVDGVQVGSGQDKSYTTPHTYNLTEYVKAGQTHVLTVEVDNSSEGMPEAMYSTFEKDVPWGHMVSEYTQTNWNGILGEMKLEASPSVYAETFKIRPDIDKNTARVEMTIARDGTEGNISGSVELRAASYNHEGASHMPGSQNFYFEIPDGADRAELTAEYQMGSGVLLWDEFTPNLYEMTAVLRFQDGDQTRASVETESFGMRKFEALYREDGGKQFAVNGRPTQLRGEINCAVFPLTGYAPMDLGSWLDVMQTYKNYGMNHVRFHTWVPPKAAFQAADQLGLYLDYELPQWGNKMFGDIDQGDTTDADYYWEETTRIFDNYLNSPSAVMMSLGNELRPGFYYYEEFLERCKELEPELLYTDIAGWSAYSENVEFSGSVPTYGANYLHRVEPTTDWDHWDNTSKTPVPFLAHEPGQLQVYPDYEEEIQKFYDKNALLKPRNLEYFKNILENAGMGDMAGKFSQSSGELAAMLYRYMTEAYLRTPGAGGFQLLGLQDFTGQGTALVGLLDAFMDSKGDITAEEFRQSCSELTVLARLPKFVWEDNEIFTADVVIPNYSAADIRTSVHWVLETEDGQEIQKGTLDSAVAEQGEVNKMGTVRIDLNGISTASRLYLRLEMEHMPEKAEAPYCVGSNEYSIWVYPSELPAEEREEIAVYTQFTNEAREKLEAGGKVLIISEGTKEALPESKAVTFRPDFWSPMFHNAENDGYVLGSYIDADHPVFAEFPTDAFADWQWYELVNNSRSILLSGAPSDLKPIIQAIPTIDQDDRLGTLFEARVGEGKLMVCSLNLLDNDSPAARQLLYSIKQYMVSDVFEPVAELDAEYIRELIPANDMKEIRLDVQEELEIGESAKINVSCVNYKGQIIETPEGAEISYRSLNEESARVSEDGMVTGIAAGIVQIQATLSTAEGEDYTGSAVVLVGAPKAQEISSQKFDLEVSSADDSYPKDNMVDKNPDTFWHSDYLDPDETMPQEVEIHFHEPTEVSSVILTARRGNSGGGILKASLQIRQIGQDDYETVIEHAAFEAEQPLISFVFPATRAESIRIIIEDSVMDSVSTNAAAIAELQVYTGDVITDVEELTGQEVRFGTELETILEKYPLPEEVELTINGERIISVPVIWDTSSYNANVAGEYIFTGTFFCGEAVNQGNKKAEYRVTVRQKDLTIPADKTAFDQAMKEAGAYLDQEEQYTQESWEEFLDVYQQAKSFGALTSATQHDTDVMTEKLLDAIAGLIESETDIQVTDVKFDRAEAEMREGETLRIRACVKPENADNTHLTWESSNSSVAEVDQEGLVKAVAPGQAIITATAQGGKTAQCIITVIKEPEPTDTPGPTSTPEPTDRPEPTTPPKPTDPSEPTDTPKPTATPKPSGKPGTSVTPGGGSAGPGSSGMGTGGSAGAGAQTGDSTPLEAASLALGLGAAGAAALIGYRKRRIGR